MKKIQKMLSACVATVIAGVMIGAVSAPSASAAVIYGDANNDGVVNISDSVALGRYLNGWYVLSNYTAVDLNVNYVVDTVDQQILLAFLTHSITSLPYRD